MATLVINLQRRLPLHKSLKGHKCAQLQTIVRREGTIFRYVCVCVLAVWLSLTGCEGANSSVFDLRRFGLLKWVGLLIISLVCGLSICNDEIPWPPCFSPSIYLSVGPRVPC